MKMMTHEEYAEWCLEQGLHFPNLCKCGNSYHYVCNKCEPTFFSRERLNPEESEVYSEFGCSMPIRFNTSKGIKTMMPGIRYDENLNEI
jgi:hypothetical protein